MASNEAAQAQGQEECTKRVLAASAAENEAITLDRDGDIPAAIKRYEECERELEAAAGLAREAYPEDHPKLVQHRKEILDRIAHLKGLKEGGKPTIPVEQQIQAVQLGMQATSAASAAVGSAGGVKTLAACAAVGAVGGFVVLGGTLGLTLSVVGGAAGAAYVATRNDKLGDAARGAGNMAIAGAEKAKKLNEEHQVTQKLTDAGSKAVTAAKNVDEKYKISDKVTHGVGTVFSKAQEIENKHKVTDKVASGFSFGLGKLSSALDAASKKSDGASSGSK